MKAHIFERACPLYEEGVLTPSINGTIAGELLITTAGIEPT
jgi:hypothetical protein